MGLERSLKPTALFIICDGTLQRVECFIVLISLFNYMSKEGRLPGTLVRITYIMDESL
jgi:hypothetical protein